MTQAVVAPQATQAPVPQVTSNPVAIYRALRDQREILGNQLESAQRLREQLVNDLSQQGQTAATKASLEKRIAGVDAHIADLDQQVAKSEQAVATAAAVPGATVRPPQQQRNGPDPDMVVGLTTLIIMTALIPITIAYARRIWRRSAKATVVLPPEVTQRMESLERGVDAIALEVERIGEGQRFLTQAMSGRDVARALNAGAAEPIALRARERLEERR